MDIGGHDSPERGLAKATRLVCQKQANASGFLQQPWFQLQRLIRGGEQKVCFGASRRCFLSSIWLHMISVARLKAAVEAAAATFREKIFLVIMASTK